MFPPFSLPLVFCSPRHGFPHDDFSCHAMFGSSIHHRTVIGFFTTSQSFPHLILVHWALIGFTKTYFFQIPEDFLLASSAVPGLYLFFKEYIAANLHTATPFKSTPSQHYSPCCLWSHQSVIYDFHGMRAGTRWKLI